MVTKEQVWRKIVALDYTRLTQKFCEEVEGEVSQLYLIILLTQKWQEYVISN